MKKSERMETFIAGLETGPAGELSPCYLGYFVCFNAAQYYEAHDVLEHLWLQGRTTESHFYQGLIQLAGAYVHLRKQHLRPEHPTDGRRLRPAARLFALARRNLAPYGARYLRLDVARLCRLCEEMIQELEAGDFERNPWHPAHPPQITLE